MQISRLRQYLLITTVILSATSYTTLLMAQDEENKAVRDVSVQRSDGKNRTSFRLVLPESSPNGLSDYIRLEFLKDKPQLARLISNVQIFCDKKNPEKNTTNLKIFAPTQKELNQGRGFRIEIGCNISSDILKEKLTLLERILSSMQPFAKESIASILETEVTKDIINTVELLLSGDLKEPLSSPLILCDIEWHSGAYLASIERAHDMKRIISNIGTIFEACRGHIDPELCLSNNHYSGTISFLTGKPPTKITGKMQDGIAIGRWSTDYPGPDANRNIREVTYYDDDGRIQKTERYIKDKRGKECAVQTFIFEYKDGQIYSMAMKKIDAYFTKNCSDTSPPMVDNAMGYQYRGPRSGKRYE